MKNQKKIQNVLSLSQEERYQYFVRKIADFEVVWGLFNNGWVMGKVNESIVLPFWPEQDFAEISANGAWAGFKATEISLDDFLCKWLPGMERENRLCSIFPTNEDSGFVVQPNDLLNAIKNEMSQYY